ncbi:hypothetical protein TSOC_010243 [Tetrabaena socialis]|uniref:Hemerythrin-like domain-containing protein n=1 Tax=Tetrabaena socialis TaxID=47790 RepID=A0A2J7ZTT0_9CHLO|nr:hypothetical protein TSOC_010243 [Tetrabaena socialis]|eukprot:PNH03683.1 hypothetical protein TSOC_010243 [Tetrabaena socialis]
MADTAMPASIASREAGPTAADLAPAGAAESAPGAAPPRAAAGGPVQRLKGLLKPGPGGRAVPSNGLDAIVEDHQPPAVHAGCAVNHRTYPPPPRLSPLSTTRTRLVPAHAVLDRSCPAASHRPQEKLTATRNLVRHISRHASAEERTLYPLVRERLPPGQRELARMLYDRMVMDDRVNKQLLDFLETHVPSSEAEWALFDATLGKFRAVEEEHLAREEAEVIEPLRALLSDEEAAKLGRQWAGAFANAPTHPHPNGPSAATGARLLHPMVGLVDRMCDALLPEPAAKAGGGGGGGGGGQS